MYIFYVFENRHSVYLYTIYTQNRHVYIVQILQSRTLVKYSTRENQCEKESRQKPTKRAQMRSKPTQKLHKHLI